MKLNCLIIDDEPFARKGMEEYVREVAFLQLIAKCENPLNAAGFLEQGTIDLIFLDIQMPKLSGIDFLKSLKNPPMIIFTTAFHEFAVEGYTLDIVDYLVKPIAFERFVKAAKKAQELHELRHSSIKRGNAAPDFIFVKSERKFEKVMYNDVMYIEAMQNYVVLHMPGKKLIAYMTMSSLEAQLPAEKFLRVHKSFIVAVSHVASIDGNDVIVNGTKIPISRTLKEQVVQRILGDNLLSR